MSSESLNTQVPHLRTIFREKEFWILIVVGILYFYRPLIFEETFFFRDLYQHFLPQKQRLVEMLKAGEAPLWDPYLHGGQPFLANINNVVLYPSNVLYLLIPVLRAFNLDIVLHIMLGSLWTYLLARVLGLLPVSSLIAGIIYGFSGYTLSLATLLNHLLAVSHLPLLLLTWHLYLSKGQKRWFVATILVGILQFLAGAPEVTIISLAFILGWSIVFPYTLKPVFHRLVMFLVLVIFIGGLSSIQLVPTLEMISKSSRESGIAYSTFSAWSLHPKRIPELVVPRFLGFTDRLGGFWGGELETLSSPYILSIYFGCLTLGLAIAGGLRSKNEEFLPVRVRRFLLLILILSIVLSLGRFLPFFVLLYEHLPWINRFRYPIKVLTACILPAALLAGYMSQIHFSSDSNLFTPSTKMLFKIWLVSGILILFSLVFFLSENFANSFEYSFFGQAGSQITEALGGSFLHTSGIMLLAALLYQYRRLKRREWQHLVLAGILAMDLLFAGRFVNPLAPYEFFEKVPELVGIIKKQIGDGKFFRSGDPSVFVLYLPSSDSVYVSRWRVETLYGYLGALYSIPVIFHEDYDRLAPKEMRQLNILVHSLPWERKLPLLSASGVTVILTADKLNISGLRPVAIIHSPSNVPFYLYNNENSISKVRFVANAEASNSNDQTLMAMVQSSFDPRKQVILQESRVPPPSTECNNAKIIKMRSDVNSSSFSVSSDCNGYLVFSEPFYPGWRAYIDGKSVPIMRANSAFSAIFFQNGNHFIERRYEPVSLRLGGLTSLFFGILLVVTIRMKRFQKYL